VRGYKAAELGILVPTAYACVALYTRFGLLKGHIMPQIGKSSRFYQNRRQRQFPGNMYAPGQQLKLSDNLVHAIGLEPPFPNLKTLNDKNGVPVTDAGQIQAWPYGDARAPY
jgi:hypothetical protein